MGRFLVALGIGLLASFGFGLLPAVASPASEVWLTADDIKSDVDLAEEAYLRVHPGYTRYASANDMRAAWEAIRVTAKTQGGMSVGDFYLAVEKALVTIRCDHTKAELPKALKVEREGRPFYLPFRWRYIEGRGIISEPGSDTGLSFGDEIMSIDGRPLAEIVDAVSGYVPIDGYTEWARRGGISESLEFMGGAVDHFGALIWSPGPSADLLVRAPDGTTRELEVERVDFNAWSELGNTQGAARDFKDAVHFERIGDKGAYLRVDTFVNYRNPVAPDTVYDPIFKAIKDEGRDELILDLRNNGGGSTDASQRLVAHLIARKMQIKTDMRVATLNLDGLKEHLSTWEKSALNPHPLAFRKNSDGTFSLRRFLSDDLKTVTPDAHAFKGDLIILTSADNSSGSTNLISVLKGLGRATLIGEKTGGSAEGTTAGVLFTLTLPRSGIKTRLPFFRYTNNVPSFDKGLGVSPDIEAPMTVDAFRAKADPALQQARAQIAP